MKDYARNWLSLGWLTDNALAGQVRAFKKEREALTGFKLPMSEIIRRLIRKGLEAEKKP